MGIIVLLVANELDLLFCLIDTPFIPWWVSIIYHIGFSLSFIPVLLRSWRVVSLLVHTPTCVGCCTVRMSTILRMRTLVRRLGFPFACSPFWVAV